MATRSHHPQRRALRPAPRNNRGGALLMLACLLFVLFGILALVIDLAVVRHTQQRLNTGARGAALEGLRYRDSGAVNEREAARDFVALVFDDDLDLTSPEVVPLGAGPIVEIGPSPGGLDAFQSIVNVDVFRPNLELNNLNVAEGDLVTGFYDASQPHNEFPPFTRADFTAWVPGDPDPSSFLVRIRRTSTADAVPGLISSGPSIPYLWGRGALIFAASGAATDPRVDGMRFSARAIADAQPAASVGPANPLEGPIEGLSRFALDLGYWNGLPTGVPVAVTIDTTGEILSGVVPVGRLVGFSELSVFALAGDTSVVVADAGPFPAVPFRVRIGNEFAYVTSVVGNTLGLQAPLAANHAVATEVRLHRALNLGDVVPLAEPLDKFAPDLAGGEVYVPLYESVGGAGERVVGFGRATLLTADVVTPAAAVLTVLPGVVAPANVAASPTRPVDAGLTTAEVNDIFALRRTVAEAIEAPALVRAYGK